MKKYLSIVIIIIGFLLTGCAKEYISVGNLSVQNLDKNNTENSKVKYLSIKTSMYNTESNQYNYLQYCNDKNNYVTNNKYYSALYLKVEDKNNEYITVSDSPSWLLINNDKISCRVTSPATKNQKYILVNQSHDIKVLIENQENQDIPVNKILNKLALIAEVSGGSGTVLVAKEVSNTLQIKDSLDDVADLALSINGIEERSIKVSQNDKGIDVKLKVIFIDKHNSKSIKPFYKLSLALTYKDTLLSNDTIDTINRNSNSTIFSWKNYKTRLRKILESTIGKEQKISTRLELFKNYTDTQIIVDSLAKLDDELSIKFTKLDRDLIVYFALTSSLKSIPLKEKRDLLLDQLNIANEFDNNNTSHDSKIKEIYKKLL